MSYFGIPELDANMDGMLAMVEKLDTVQAQLGELTGTASSEDEHITVTVDAQGTVTELTLNPRVMRMASEELAETLKQVVNEAQTNMQTRAQELMSELTDAAGMSPPATAEESTANVKDAVDELMRAVRGERTPEEVTGAMTEATRKVTGINLP